MGITKVNNTIDDPTRKKLTPQFRPTSKNLRKKKVAFAFHILLIEQIDYLEYISTQTLHSVWKEKRDKFLVVVVVVFNHINKILPNTRRATRGRLGAGRAAKGGHGEKTWYQPVFGDANNVAGY